MRAELLYILLVIFVLFFVSAEKSHKDQNNGNISSCQPIISICLSPEIHLSTKELLTGLYFFRLIREKQIENIYRHRIDLSSNYLRSCQTKTLNFRPLIKESLRSIFHSPETEDDHHLS